jgi:hypothetical protein
VVAVGDGEVEGAGDVSIFGSGTIDGVALGVLRGAARIVTPLFQTNFFPDFTQVKSFPLYFWVVPSF